MAIGGRPFRQRPERDEAAGADERVAAYRRAVALLRRDRATALGELVRCFRAGAVPDGFELAGAYRGQLLAITLGKGLDGLVETLGRIWMPWQGKTFDPGRGAGHNLLSDRARLLVRAVWPAYGDLWSVGDGLCSGFGFRSSVASSLLDPGGPVVRIDYAAVPDNPWPVRRIVDEVVLVGGGVHLGQALVRSRDGGVRRAGWFSLQRGGRA